MAKPKKLFISISDHGFGHLAQMSAWLNDRRTTERFDVTLQTTLPEKTVRSVITAPITHRHEHNDPGISMRDALHVDPNHTYSTYLKAYNNRDALVAQQRKTLRTENPDIVLSNVSWTPLLAAQSLGLPNYALSSLNWSALFNHYCGHYPLGHKITAWIRKAYTQSNGFIKLTPGMPMADLPGRRIGFTARVGAQKNLNAGTAHPRRTHWVLVSPGGLPLEMSLANWPRCAGIQWIFTRPHTPKHRPDMLTQASVGLPFIDLMASVDAVITKPGYGMFTEAAAHGRPVLYIQRPDWPEQPYLIDWLKQQVPCAAIDWLTFQTHGWLPMLKTLLTHPSAETVFVQRQKEIGDTLNQITNILTAGRRIG